jgi:hypothetical protein
VRRYGFVPPALCTEPHGSPCMGLSKTFAAQYFCQNLDSFTEMWCKRTLDLFSWRFKLHADRSGNTNPDPMFSENLRGLTCAAHQTSEIRRAGEMWRAIHPMKELVHLMNQNSESFRVSMAQIPNGARTVRAAHRYGFVPPAYFQNTGGGVSKTRPVIHRMTHVKKSHSGLSSVCFFSVSVARSAGPSRRGFPSQSPGNSASPRSSNVVRSSDEKRRKSSNTADLSTTRRASCIRNRQRWAWESRARNTCTSPAAHPMQCHCSAGERACQAVRASPMLMAPRRFLGAPTGR